MSPPIFFKNKYVWNCYTQTLKARDCPKGCFWQLLLNREVHVSSFKTLDLVAVQSFAANLTRVSKFKNPIFPKGKLTGDFFQNLSITLLRFWKTFRTLNLREREIISWNKISYKHFGHSDGNFHYFYVYFQYKS